MSARSRGGRRPSKSRGGWFPSTPLTTRRVMAGVIVVLLVAIAVLLDVGARADFARSAELVRTQEQEVGTLVEVDYRGRSGTYYIIDVDGHDRELSYGDFIQDEPLGSAVPFVVDPEDETRLIAVGTPQDWEDQPLEDAVLTIVLVGIALFLGCLIASRIAPEDFDGALGPITGTNTKKPVPRRSRRS